MNILYTLNDAFVPQVATSMCSIMENNKSHSSITFFLVHTDISVKHQQQLVEFVSTYNRTVEFVQIEDLKTYIDFDFDFKTSWFIR